MSRSAAKTSMAQWKGASLLDWDLAAGMVDVAKDIRSNLPRWSTRVDWDRREAAIADFIRIVGRDADDLNEEEIVDLFQYYYDEDLAESNIGSNLRRFGDDLSENTWYVRYLQLRNLVLGDCEESGICGVIRNRLGNWLDGLSRQRASSFLDQHLQSGQLMRSARRWVKGLKVDSKKKDEEYAYELIRADIFLTYVRSQLAVPKSSWSRGLSDHIKSSTFSSDVWVCVDLVNYLSQFICFRSRTLGALQMLESKAVVWQKERSIDPSIGASFLAPSVALAFVLSEAESTALAILRSEEGHLAVKVGSQLAAGEPVTTAQWSLKGIATGRDSWKTVASTLRWPYVGIGDCHSPSVNWLGPLPYLDPGLRLAVKSTSLHEIVSPPLAIPLAS